MQIYKGKSVFGGIAIGKIQRLQKDEQLVKRVKVEDADAEMDEIRQMPSQYCELHSFRSSV
ncbi:MAG: hypothetical protein ACLRIL_01715 [Fusicatenibacter saccharivorans]